MSSLTVGGASALDGIHLGPAKSLDATDSFLVPEDLAHLTRRSLFLVVDSDSSSSFMRLQVRLRSRG